MVMACTLGAAGACGGDVEGAGGAPASGVKGTAIDTYNVPPTPTKAPSPKDGFGEISAIVTDAKGETSYPGTLDDQGNVLIPDVPEGKYWLSFKTHNEDLVGAPEALTLRETDARTLDLGVTRSHRAGLTRMTKASFLAVSAPLGVPWQTLSVGAMGEPQLLSDTLQVFSRSTAVMGYYQSDPELGGSAPENGATSLSGWRVNLLDAISFSDTDISELTPKDDVVLLHEAARQVDDPSAPAGSPWQSYTTSSVVEALVAPPITLDDGATASVTGTFVATPQKTFNLDYRGSAWNALLADAPTANFSFVGLDLSIVMEPGSPLPNQGADATLFEITTFSFPTYANPDCDPAACDLAACPTGCGSGASITLPGDHQHTYSYGNPFDYGQELFGVGISFSTDVSALFPEETSNRLRGSITTSVPVSEAKGAPVVPLISLPRSVLVAGKPAPVDVITMGVGATPTIEFQPPTTGKPDLYRIRVVDLEDIADTQGATRASRTVLTINTQSTKVTLPKGVLVAGKHYYAQVIAELRPGYDAAKPYVYPQRNATAQTYTGMFMP